MTIPEACQLVMQAGTESAAQSIFILDMGEPVRILDLAKRIIELSGKEIDIVFTGLRQGEKLHESLHLMEEELSKSSHNLVWAAKSGVTEPGLLSQIYELGIAHRNATVTSKQSKMSPRRSFQSKTILGHLGRDDEIAGIPSGLGHSQLENMSIVSLLSRAGKP